jgi:drug/metabolite transporter (DMT)-like permease
MLRQTLQVRRLLLLSFIWGWSFLFIKVGVEGLTPSTVAAIRVALGALVLHLFLRVKRVALPTDRRIWAHFAVVGLVGSALPFTMLAWGEERITSALTSVLNASTPLFTAIFSVMLLRDRLRSVQIVGLVVGLCGVGVGAGIGASDLTGSSLAGGLASVVAGACYGLSFAWSKRHLMAMPSIVAATGQLTAATILLAPFAITTTAVDGASLSWRRIGAIATLGVVGTGIAYVLNFRIIADLGATRASLVTYLIPVVAVAVGVVVLSEPFTWRIVGGGVLIVGGIVLVNRVGGGTRRRGAVAVATALIAALLAGCGGGGGSGSGSGPCGRVVTEPLDRQYLVHVLPGAADPHYQTDPPTSGPHQPTPAVGRVLEKPLSRPVQVGLLEEGKVLLQHRGLLAADRSKLESMAGGDVVVAPSPDLPKGAAVVATAWVTKQVCSRLDTGELRKFVQDHANQGPGTP